MCYVVKFQVHGKILMALYYKFKPISYIAATGLQMKIYLHVNYLTMPCFSRVKPNNFQKQECYSNIKRFLSLKPHELVHS